MFREKMLPAEPRGLQLVARHTLEIQKPPIRKWKDEQQPLDDPSEPPEIAGCMTDDISHDMRNHLCAVFANAELMSQSTRSQAEREELLKDVHSAIRSSIAILDSLLLPSNTGHTHNFRLHSLNELIAHEVKMVRIHPDARHVELSFADHPILEACIDSRELGRAVYNLLLNACQAVGTGASPSPGKIQVELREERASMQIRVIDNGPGVPETTRRILRKSPAPADKSLSIGLGLTIARRAAHKHGGFLELEESAMGKTVFVLHLAKIQLPPAGRLCRPAIAHACMEREQP